MVNSNKKPTTRQLMALDIWIKDGRKSKAEALRKAGYCQSVIDQPQKVFNSPIVIKELELRGYDFRGIRNKVQVSVLYEEKKPIIQLNPTELTFENIIELRNKLAKIHNIDFNKKSEKYIDHSYSPNGKGVDIFSDEGKYNIENTSIENYSSM